MINPSKLHANKGILSAALRFTTKATMAVGGDFLGLPIWAKAAVVAWSTCYMSWGVLMQLNGGAPATLTVVAVSAPIALVVFVAFAKVSAWACRIARKPRD